MVLYTSRLGLVMFILFCIVRMAATSDWIRCTGWKQGEPTSTNKTICCSGFKAATSGNGTGKESAAALRGSFAINSQNANRGSCHGLRAMASYKVAILGAGGGIDNVKGVAADLSQRNTPQVLDFTGASELGNCLKGADVVVIPAGVPRKPGMTRDDLFNINACIVKTLVEAVADNCPNALILIISYRINSTVPIAAEKKNLKLIDVDAGITILPLLSKTKPAVTFIDEEVEQLTVRIQNAGTDVLEAKADAGSATLSMAYAAARFVESHALDGDGDIYELGRNGVEASVPSDLVGLSEYEEKALEALKPEVKASIEKVIEFVRKQPVTA
ncbi:malate dehydrogenase [Hibiscus syriacus]|uniref:malate dehydrogenase n=1 Tax=Hibiscus syriacus TaxID=106335 RepID=A0A6A3CD11_HIBSY|nr:malate dehydrogenase [Hibiscus syriacus]